MNYVAARHFAQRHSREDVEKFLSIINRPGSTLEDLHKAFPHYSVPQLCRFRKKLFVRGYILSSELEDVLRVIEREQREEKLQNKVYRINEPDRLRAVNN